MRTMRTKGDFLAEKRRGPLQLLGGKDELQGPGGSWDMVRKLVPPLASQPVHWGEIIYRANHLPP